MPDPTNEVLDNIQTFVLPNVSETIRDTMVSPLGTLIYNTDTNKIDVCKVANTAAAGSWGEVTSS